MSKTNGGLRRGATAFILSILALFTVACGSSGDNPNVQPVISSNVVQTFTGNYLGSNDLGDNQFATVNLVVDDSSQINASLRVSRLLAQTVSPGGYLLTGTADPDTGAFTATTPDATLGVITISGTLPRGNANAQYQLALRGQTFTGTIQAAALGLPTVANDGGTATLLAGGFMDVTGFTASAGFNTDALANNTSGLTGYSGTGLNGVDTVTVVASRTLTGGNIQDLTLSTMAAVTQTLTVGQTYIFSTATPNSGAKLSLVEYNGTTPVKAWAAGTGTTGQITLISRDANGAKISFQFNNVVVDNNIPNNAAAGTFNVSGEATIGIATSL